MARKYSFLTVVAGLALIAGCSTVTEGAATADDTPSTSPSATTAATNTVAATPSTSPAGAAPAAAPCDPATIADDLGRPQSQVNLGRCLGDWALLDNGGQYGDTDYLARKVDGRWVAYTAFPTSICRADAVRDGAPAEIHMNFRDCAPAPAPASVDLGLSTPMSSPPCDGSGIIILRSAVDPANYARDVRQALDANPGARYLRTDRSCPSLSPVDANGNAIYAVYQHAGRGKAEICSALGRAPSGAYAKILDTTTDPTQATVSC